MESSVCVCVCVYMYLKVFVWMCACEYVLVHMNMDVCEQGCMYMRCVVFECVWCVNVYMSMCAHMYPSCNVPKVTHMGD